MFYFLDARTDRDGLQIVVVFDPAAFYDFNTVRNDNTFHKRKICDRVGEHFGRTFLDHDLFDEAAEFHSVKHIYAEEIPRSGVRQHSGRAVKGIGALSCFAAEFEVGVTDTCGIKLKAVSFGIQFKRRIGLAVKLRKSDVELIDTDASENFAFTVEYLQPQTVFESPVVYYSQAVSDLDALKKSAIGKCKPVYFRQTVADLNLLKSGALPKRIRTDIYKTVSCNQFFHRFAFCECRIENLSHPISEFDFFERFTRVKSIFIYNPDPVSDPHLFKLFTFFKSSFTDIADNGIVNIY